MNEDLPIQRDQEERFYNIIWEIMDFARNDLDVDEKTLVSYLKRHLAHAIRIDYEYGD
jgi:inorganic pyrophosphatase